VLATIATPEDLLVVGSHRTGFLRGRAFGAASVYIVAAARSSVLVVPNLPFEGRRGVVVGVSGTPSSEAALLQGAREAARGHQPLMLIHARPPMPHEEAAVTGEYRASAARTVIARASSHALIDIPHLDLSSRIVADNVGSALLSASTDAALLVLGRGHTETPPSLSAVVHDVLMNLNAPVLIVP
jgi:nucleotide-binding universal stress UspA family protein